MPTIKTAIDIAASPEMVWRVLTDFPAYPKWNPFIRSVKGSAVAGKKLKVHMRLPRGRSYRFSARVVKAVPATELRWQGNSVYRRSPVSWLSGLDLRFEIHGSTHGAGGDVPLPRARRARKPLPGHRLALLSLLSRKRDFPPLPARPIFSRWALPLRRRSAGRV